MTDVATPVSAAQLPPGPPRIVPKALQGIAFFAARRRTTQWLARRYGGAFTLNLPVFGRLVVVAEPELAKRVFMSRADNLGAIEPNLSRLLGSGSVFGLEGAEHRRRRKLLAQPFHAANMKNFERIVEQETLREIENWPEGTEFATLPAMKSITLNVILRAVFGAEGDDFDELRRVIVPWAKLGSRLSTLPMPRRTYGRYTPWGRLATWRHRYDVVIDRLIDNAQRRPASAEHTDILSLMLASSYDDGSVMSRKDIRDDLLTLLVAGHETTATTLAWAFERLSRQPEVLSALVAEADTADNVLRHAAIYEVQRTRSVIDFSGRRVRGSAFELGPNIVPPGYSIVVSISACHNDSESFPDPDRFDPQRYIEGKPSPFAWIPFGGGTRRCAGAAFAKMEMDVVLRTVLRHWEIHPADTAEETMRTGGLGFLPSGGGRVMVRRRAVAAA
ncbi:cytochrome P450 [Mycobacterium paragordonae]|uniref:Cytochrome P450 138 n=1 Tax=Mycobacterium paragordonae TaxID=1389713 RepID=A0ABQ1CD57_9MYCO|nr:cytochrome P450 [Mycobacterium paragordonae]AYE93554.1 cytochrome P450 [Mycobacterium paragordonae]GFG82438.1 putative cytochrome P450 138 [Mycobacterium paragordonae]